jgi:putative SOS response-associated peptidase YedK
VCGRFVMITDLSAIVDEFGIVHVSGDVRPSYNIAPGSTVAAVINDGSNRLVHFRWGLVPSWARDPAMGSRLINARGETVAEKPSFRAAFKKRRCLIVASGFYEWQRRTSGKIPMYISLKSEKPFGFAGLFETWQSPEGEVLRTCTIITTDANELIRPIHDRMPVIIPPGQAPRWLDPSTEDTTHLLSLLAPYPESGMTAYAVSPLVNSPLHDSPLCITPVASRS